MGPLTGIKVVEFAGIGPGPMAAMLLADLGADVLKLDRPAPSEATTGDASRFDLLSRGRKSVSIDLKHPCGLEAALQLVKMADVLIEGFRPGTMERLKLGPMEALSINPKLVYGRMTGWGQRGPLAHAAGHDINYIALTGALASIGTVASGPTPPLNLVGDMGGGALYLAFGIACALLERNGSGRGQVVDAAMTDGASSLMTIIYGLYAAGLHTTRLGTNLLDSGSPIYNVYRCSDGKYVALGTIEPKFQEVLLDKLGLPMSVAKSTTFKTVLQELFATRPRDHWCDLLEGTDACFAPVLSLDEAPSHPHNAARGTFIEVNGIVQPAPAPRFSRSTVRAPTPPQPIGAGSVTGLRDWGFSETTIAELIDSGALGVTTRMHH